MPDSQLLPVFSGMAATSLVQGESLGETKVPIPESKSPAQAILSETRNAVAALALVVGIAPAMASEPVPQGQAPAKVAMASPYAAERSPEQGDFLAGLDRHLKALADRGIVAQDTASGIGRDFRKFDLKTYRQPGFEYAIPTIRPFNEPYGPLLEKSLQRSTSHGLAEIVGVDVVTEENVTDVFRRMFASKKEDGASYEMFVREVYRLLIEDGYFHTKTGEVDKQAVYDAMDSYRATYARWQQRFAEMRQDGSLKRFVTAVNNAMAYADRKSLTFKPAQVRKGLVQTASCIAAKPEDDPSLYADSCGYAMTWMAERPHPGAIELEFYNPETGASGYKRALAPWDAKYALEVYGPVFSDTQAKANDNFWRDYFKLYLGTARANEAERSLRETEALDPLDKSITRLARLLRCYAEGTPVDGRKVALADVQAELDTARRLKAEVDRTVGEKTKSEHSYQMIASDYALIVSRAVQVGAH